MSPQSSLLELCPRLFLLAELSLPQSFAIKLSIRNKKKIKENQNFISQWELTIQFLVILAVNVGMCFWHLLVLVVCY